MRLSVIVEWALLTETFDFLRRDEGLLILSGGLTVHTFEDISSFNEKTAKPVRSLQLCKCSDI